MGLKTVDVEEDETDAERFNEVIEVSDQQEDFPTATWDSDDAAKTQRGPRGFALPRTYEPLQSKQRLMGGMWFLLFLRFSTALLSDVNSEVLRQYADFYFGSKVCSMPLPGSS
eukprot:6019671-Karenia_brevis.AAC.1